MVKKLLVQVAIVVIVIVAAGVAFRFLGNPFAVTSDRVVNVSNLEQQISSIGEMATLQYDYTNVVDLKDSRKIRGWNVPLTEKSFIVVLDGTMKIGIDTFDIRTQYSPLTQTISITIPKAKILSHAIHENTLRVLDQKSGLFNSIQIEDYTTTAAEQKAAIENKVSESDKFTRAENDAVIMLQALIGGIVSAEYSVNITVDTTS